MFEKKDDGEFGYSRRFWVQAVILALLIIAIGFSTQRTANRTAQLSQETIAYAQQTQDCFNQLSSALKERSRIALEDNAESQRQRSEVAKWLNDLLAPPPDIKKIQLEDPNYNANPQYVKWGIEVTQMHLKVINDSLAEQDRLDKERAAHPIPEPNCGNKLPG